MWRTLTLYGLIFLAAPILGAAQSSDKPVLALITLGGRGISPRGVFLMHLDSRREACGVSLSFSF